MAKKKKSPGSKKTIEIVEELKKKKIIKEDFESNLEKLLVPKPKKQDS
ncbi:MAG: hypothetical protein WC756_04930 [Taibaiella sp.]|jgi:hypothetical protein